MRTAEGEALRITSDERRDQDASVPELRLDGDRRANADTPYSGGFSAEPVEHEHFTPDPGIRKLVQRSAWIGVAGVSAMVGGLATAAVLPGWAGVIAAAAGAVALGFGWSYAWRQIGSPLRALVGIGEALEGYRGGELGGDAMRLVTPEPFGAGWNRLVSHRGAEIESDRAASVDRRSSGGGSAAPSSLSAAVDAMWQGLMLVDADLRIMHINGAAAVLMGVSRSDADGVPLGALDVPAEVVEAVRQVVSGKRGRDATDVVRGEGAGQSVVRLSARRVRSDDRGEALVILEDVTQQRVAEEAQHTMLAQAVHELRTPLTTIRLNVELAIESDEDSRVESLDVINAEARRLERVVNEMLSVSEMESGAFEVQPSDIRLDALFDELRSDYTAAASSKSVGLVFELPPKWPVAFADREKLTVALHNLLGNAIKYTPEQGSVTVRVEADDTTLSVDVEDTGIGIAPEEQDRVFERFYRASDGRVSAVTGSGLGLATAREIARRHGGDITVRSAVDQGSVFTLRMPIAASNTGEQARAA